jgi:sensor histidine kinase YesM
MNLLHQISNNINIVIEQSIALAAIHNFTTEYKQYLTVTPTNTIQDIINTNYVENKILNNSTTFEWLDCHTALIGKNYKIYTDGSDKFLLSYEDVICKSWYKSALKNPNKIIWLNSHKSFFANKFNDNMFSIIKILNHNNVDYSGILITSFSEKLLYKYYKDSLNDYTSIYIITGDGVVVSGSNRIKVGKKIDPSILDFVISSENVHGKITINEDKYFINFIKQPKIDWFIVQVIPVKIISNDLKLLKSNIIISAFLCFIIFFIVAILFSKKMVTPIMDITEHIKNHSLPTTEQTSKITEVNIINKEYSLIISELKDTIDHLIWEQKERRKKEIHALQMQINPHFLYNTLNSIKCLLWTDKVHLIEPMVNALTNLLRQTISKDGEFVTIEKEIENTKNYVFIQNIRASDTITAHYYVDDRVKNCKIPKLSLQPIVENGIFHGIEPNQGGIISINCMMFHGSIQIEIMDNGVGMDKETIDKILLQKQPSKSNFSSIGINNVNERIKLYFGEEYGLQIRSKLGVGTTVILKIPKHK